MGKEGVRRKKKQDHRGRRRGLREGEKGEREKGEGGGGEATEFRFDCHFPAERQKESEKTEWCKDLLSGFLWQQQAIILNCHLL